MPNGGLVCWILLLCLPTKKTASKSVIIGNICRGKKMACPKGFSGGVLKKLMSKSNKEYIKRKISNLS